ncbi:hypothetical protein L3X38_017430 [Prunus dulcis]|uniref:Uncharacterized protein n=1 Tax=Prunus dulcis TaxID=3755 RepID=A0AAD4W7A3_PRUDU|nr:hypothetical protein L3X38_017430 [Prunus dulcis]
MYKAKKILSALGMSYEKIHSCPNDCILYKKDYEDSTNCPTCGISRWKEDKDSILNQGVSAKVVWYFPLIPRFERMFQSHKTAKTLTWHAIENQLTVICLIQRIPRLGNLLTINGLSLRAAFYGKPEYGTPLERLTGEEVLEKVEVGEFCTEHLSYISIVGLPSSQKMGVSKPLSGCTVSLVDRDLLN